MIVNTFISDGGPIPEYTKVSLRQARHTNPDTDISFISADNQDIFDELNIKWVPQGSIDSELLREFNECCWFKRHGTPQTTYPSPELFWHRTAERIYYLEAYISQNDLKNVFHFENDVLIYGDLSTVPVSGKIAMMLPMSRNKSTFAFTHIPSPQHLHKVCKYFNKLMSTYGEQTLSQHLRDHVSEMSLLHMAFREWLVAGFPILPTQSSEMVFDPGSYGQFLGGTNNGHSKGFTDPEHFIGELINDGDLNVEFNDEPSVNGVKIFNLHIHSKNLKEFASYEKVK
tara:strand:+ start:1192 stop:2046 length:855 start_codon:yes stop_codon:yes gene_type:complete